MKLWDIVKVVEVANISISITEDGPGPKSVS